MSFIKTKIRKTKNKNEQYQRPIKFAPVTGYKLALLLLWSFINKKLFHILEKYFIQLKKFKKSENV